MNKQEMSIGQKLTEIQTQLKASKDKKNSFGKYNYRSAEDVLEALKPYLKEYGCYVTINEKYIKGDRLKSVSKIFCNSTGNYVKATAIVGVDLDQKGMAVAQQFGSASSYGKKYSLGNLFLIDDTKDADATNDHGKSRTTLEKPTLSGEALTKAIKFVTEGKGTLADIRKKYSILDKDIKSFEK